MIDALRYEVVRLWSIRSTYWILGTALLFQLLLTMLIASQLPSSGPLAGGDQPFAILVTVGGSLGIAPLFVAYMIGLLGVFSMGHEYRHGMIRATLTALPSRVAVMVAKVLTTAVTAVVAAVIFILVALLSATLHGVGMPSLEAFWSISVGTVVYTALFALSGLALAAITRHQTAAVALLFLLPTLVEGLVKAVVLALKAASDSPMTRGGLVDVLKYLPYDAGGQMYTRLPLDEAYNGLLGVVPLGPVGGGIVMAVFVGALLAVATALFLRRDA